jgi:hypothetical protein
MTWTEGGGGGEGGEGGREDLELKTAAHVTTAIAGEAFQSA